MSLCCRRGCHTVHLSSRRGNVGPLAYSGPVSADVQGGSVVNDTPGGEILVYEAPDGRARVEVRLDRETVWLTQRQMADLFTTSADNIGLHLKNIFLDKELDETATTEDFSVVQLEGKRNVHREVKHYNLDAIISVGYRVSSPRAVQKPLAG
jgi:Virulence protein RhuM family